MAPINTAEVRLIYKTKVKASERPQIKKSNDAFGLFYSFRDMDFIEHI